MSGGGGLPFLRLRLQHCPPGSINYAHVAMEEMDEMAAHPPKTSLFGGGQTHTAWDKVGLPLAAAAAWIRLIALGLLALTLTWWAGRLA